MTYILYLSINDRIINIKKRESNYKKIKLNILTKRFVDKLGTEKTEKTDDKCKVKINAIWLTRKKIGRAKLNVKVVDDYK